MNPQREGLIIPGLMGVLNYLIKSPSVPLSLKGEGTTLTHRSHQMPASGGFEIPLNKGGNRGMCLVMGVTLAIFVGALLSAGCGKAKQQAGPPPVPVLVDTVRIQDVPFEIQAIGAVQAYNSVSIRARVGGELKQVYFTEGSDVRDGDLLFLIDPAPYQAALEAARAQLARDSVEWINSRETVRRYAELVAKEYITPQQYDDLVARAKSLEATMEQNRANLDNAELNFRYCWVRSPISGRTGRRMADAGNLIQANSQNPLVVINQVTPVYVEFTVPERFLTEILTLSSAGELKVQSYPPGREDNPHSGELSFIDNMVDEGTGTVRLKATFANEDRTLWPGSFVNTVLVLKTLANSVVAPSQAIASGQEGQYVFVVKEDLTVESRPVTISYERANLSVIEQGLQGGEVVITDGHLRLKTGSAVQVRSNLEAGQEEPGAGRNGLTGAGKADKSGAGPVERSHPHQGGNFLPVQGAQLRQITQQSAGDHRPQARNTADDLGVFVPQGALAQKVHQVPVQFFQQSPKFGQQNLDVAPHPGSGHLTPVLLPGDHLHQLSTTARQSGQLQLRRLRQWARLRPDCLPIMGDHLGVDLIGLGQLTQGLGKISNKTGVHQHCRQVLLGQGEHQGSLVAAGGFQDHQFRVQFQKTADQRENASFIIGQGEKLSRGTDSNVQLPFGNINANKCGFSCHGDLPSLQIRALSPSDCSG